MFSGQSLMLTLTIKGRKYIKILKNEAAEILFSDYMSVIILINITVYMHQGHTTTSVLNIEIGCQM